MPKIDDFKPMPEYEGKESYVKGDKKSIENIESMFKRSDSRYRIMILDPKQVVQIPHMPTFFSNPQLPTEGVLQSSDFNNGQEAYTASKKLIDSAKDNYIEQGNIQFNMYAVVVSESPLGEPIVQGVIQAEVNKNSTNYFIANNPNPQVLKAMGPEQEMVD